MDLDEEIPTNGRILIFEVNTSQSKFKLVHIEKVEGSV